MNASQSMKFGHFGINCDVEGNPMEFYTDTPWYTPQPCGVPFDLSKSDEEIHRETEAMCRSRPGFEPAEIWRARLAENIRTKLQESRRASMTLSFMMPARQALTRTSLVIIAVFAFALSAHAQDYPARPVTVVLALAAGTGLDTVARTYGESSRRALADRLCSARGAGPIKSE